MVSLPYVPVSPDNPEIRPAAAKTSPALLRNYATAMTTVLFAVAAVTGVLMFFHVGGHTLTGLHEWLGMLFVAASLLHVMRNWRGFVKVATTGRIWVLSGVAAIVAAGFLGVPQTQEVANPVTALIQATATAPISAVAPVLDMPVEEMIARLEMAGIEVAGPDQSLTQVAAAQGTDTRRLIAVVLKTGATAR